MDISLISQIMKNPIRRKILQKLIYHQGLKFSELCGDMASNKFNFHLQYLIDKGIIEKQEDVSNIYNLSKEYHHVGNYFDVEPMVVQSKPTVVVSPAIFNKDKTKILLQLRTKEPFRDFYATPTAKAKMDEHLIETLKREVMEETGLEINAKLKLITSNKIIDNHEQITHNIIHWFECEITGGELRDDIAGKNIWMDVKEVLGKKRVRGKKIILDIPFALSKINGGPIVWYNSIYNMDNETYKVI